MVSLTNHLATVAQGLNTRPTVAAQSSYADRLTAALERSELSVREVAKRMAAETGNPVDDERSAIYRYKKKTEPEADRAAILSRILDAPELEVVTPLSEKRRDLVASLVARLAELEGEVARLRAERDFALREVVVRLVAVEEAQAQLARQADQQSNTSTE